jgi:nitrile hydratase subunit beta
MNDAVTTPPQPVHDLGGRPGFGPVPVHDDVLFHADWERRAFAVTQFSQRASSFNTDAFRHGVEREDPEVYLSAPYFEKWIRNAERMLVEGGVVASDEIAARMRGTTGSGTPRRTTDATAPAAKGTLRTVSQPPRFDVGDRVMVSATHRPPGHTRLPAYVRGRQGTVIVMQGGWIYPDTNAHGQGENPTWVYGVRFDSSELWPDDAAPGHTVIVDLFEPYLEQP